MHRFGFVNWVGKIDWPPVGRQRSWCFENYSLVRLNRHVFGVIRSFCTVLVTNNWCQPHCQKHYHLYERKVLSVPPILDLHTLPLEGFLIWTPHPSENCLFSLILSFANFGLLIPHTRTTSPPQNFQWHSMAWVRIFSGTIQYYGDSQCFVWPYFSVFWLLRINSVFPVLFYIKPQCW